MKTEFVYVTPKNFDTKDIFIHDMDRLHSCKVRDRKNGMMKLSSISGRYEFWMNENDEDKNWKVVK